MSEENNTQPSSPNMRGRWKRNAPRGSGRPAPQTPANFGAVEDIKEVKETLSGSNISGYGNEPARETETVVADVTVTTECLETDQPETKADCGCGEDCECKAETPANCGCEASEKQEETPCCQEDKQAEASPCCCAETAPEQKTEDKPAAETPATEKTEDEAELLKTDWRQERKRYVGLRPDPVDARPDRVRSRPYDEKAYQAERPDRGERQDRGHRPDRGERQDRGPRGSRLNTETAAAPRVSEYTPSRDRSERNASREKLPAKAAPKKGLISKIMGLLGLGKKKAEAAPKARPQGDRPYNRGPRQGGDRDRNRNYRGGEQGGHDSRGQGGNYRGGRRRRSGGGRGGQGRSHGGNAS